MSAPAQAPSAAQPNLSELWDQAVQSNTGQALGLDKVDQAVDDAVEFGEKVISKFIGKDTLIPLDQVKLPPIRQQQMVGCYFTVRKVRNFKPSDLTFERLERILSYLEKDAAKAESRNEMLDMLTKFLKNNKTLTPEQRTQLLEAAEALKKKKDSVE